MMSKRVFKNSSITKKISSDSTNISSIAVHTHITVVDFVIIITLLCLKYSDDYYILLI